MSLLYLNLSQTLVVLAGVTAVLILAALNVESGLLTVGGFVTLNTYILQAFQPLNFLGSIYRQIRQSLIDMESLFDVLEEPTESDAINARTEIKGSTITFDNVHFAYEAERPILQGVSLTVQPKQTVAIVGETGCGKTTIEVIVKNYRARPGCHSLWLEPVITITTACCPRRDRSRAPSHCPL